MIGPVREVSTGAIARGRSSAHPTRSRPHRGRSHPGTDGTSRNDRKNRVFVIGARAGDLHSFSSKLGSCGATGGAHHAALRRAAQRRVIFPILQVTCVEQVGRQPQEALIVEFLAQDRQQHRMVDAVEALRYVSIDEPLDPEALGGDEPSGLLERFPTCGRRCTTTMISTLRRCKAGEKCRKSRLNRV